MTSNQHNMIRAAMLLRDHWLGTAFMLFIAIGLVGATAFRIQKNYSQPSTTFDWENRGYSDFHNGTYFPTRAFLDGKSPYSADVALEYQMARQTPPYSPIVFLLHSPLAFFPLEVARILYFVFSIATMALLAWFCLVMCGQKFRWFDWLGFLNLILLSRPGHITLFTGYFTAEIIVGCLLAIHFGKSRPKQAGFGILLASIKPNFVLPLLILLSCRKNFAAVGWGVALCILAGVAGLGWLSYHNGLEQIIYDVGEGQDALHLDETEMPVNTWTRVDLVGMSAKILKSVPDDLIYLTFMTVFVGLIGFLLLNNDQKESGTGAAGISGMIGTIAILLSIYHHSYDCLLVVVPMSSLLFYSRATLPFTPRLLGISTGILVAVPMFNYLSTKSAMETIGLQPLSFAWQITTLINGICLLSAMTLLIIELLRIKRVNTNQQT
ncbi:MAG: glycosyltransferase family 87 protein [Planctomycetota bacterium]